MSLLNAYGSQCSALSFDLSTRVPDVSHLCRNLEVLSLKICGRADVSFPFRSLLASQTNLEELYVFCYSIPTAAMYAAAEHRAGLKKLAIDDIDYKPREAVTGMLEVAGKTLHT